jgi:hypothetical protein
MYEPLEFNNGYEISNLHPHPIRKKDSKIHLEDQYLDELKTFVVNIDGDIKTKAWLVAHQFVGTELDSDGDRVCPSKCEIKFLNKNKCDYRTNNLEWIPKSKPRQPTKAEYLDELPETALKIDSFNGHEYKDYYFDPESKQVIQVNASKSKSKIKIIKPSISNGRNIIVIKDSTDKRRTVTYDKLVKHFENLDNESKLMLTSATKCVGGSESE